MLPSKFTIITAFIISFLFFACTKKEDSSSNPTKPKDTTNTDIPVIDGGKSYLSFDDSSKTTWYASTLTRNKSGNTISMRATGKEGEVFELETVNLTGDTKVPVGASVGYLLFTNIDGETFDTRIGGGGNVFYSRNDKERVEGTFLFPLVQSISNNFMELNNGSFGFDWPAVVGMSMNRILDFGNTYYFVEKPTLYTGGTTFYTSGPPSGYSIVATSPTGIVDEQSVVYNGNAGSNYSYSIDFSSLTNPGNHTVNVDFKRDDEIINSASETFYVLPIYGTYKLYPLNGAPANSSTIFIEPLGPTSTEYYKVSGSMFGKTLKFVDDGSGQIECYDTFNHLGDVVTNIYFYPDGINSIHMAIHSSSFSYFYLLQRQQ